MKRNGIAPLLALCRTFIPQSMDMAEQEIRDLGALLLWSITVQKLRESGMRKMTNNKNK